MLKRLKYPLLASMAMFVSAPCMTVNAADETKPVSATATAATKATPAPASIAAPISDPAFAQYVDVMLIGRAWETLDADLLTDCALQLAEGERILMRNHKAGISSKELLALAVKVAADKRDAKALDRLASIADHTKNTTVTEQVASAKKLAGQSRKIDPAASVSATEISPTQLAVYQNAITGVKASGIVGDASYLKTLEEGLNDSESALASLNDSQKAYLKKIMGETREIIPSEGNPKLNETLTKLKNASRGGFSIKIGSGSYGGGSSYGHQGHNHGSSYSGGGYGGYTPSYPSYPSYPTYHNTSHYDYHPGSYQPHGNHIDYVPGHYDLHQTGHYHW
jgi:hypothetical protein